MILLTEVATKLQELLNSANSPVDFSFVVKTQGYHLDRVAGLKKGKNTIPVFISTIGGEYNPVPNLKEANYTIQVVMYYPIRFKEDFYLIEDYLNSTFVGKTIDFGTQSGNGLCNMSVSQYGEIIGVDLEQFAEWVEDTFEDPKIVQKTEGVTEPYMSKTFNLFISTIGSGFKYGNDVSLSLSFTYDNTTYTLNNAAFDEVSIQSHVDPNGQQILNAGIPEIEGTPATNSYGSSLKLYYNDTSFFNKLLELWLGGLTQTLSLNLKYIIKPAVSGVGEISYSRTVYIESITMPIQKGEPLYLVLSFSKKASLL